MHVRRISTPGILLALLLLAGCSKEKPAPEPVPAKDATEVRKTPDDVKKPDKEPVEPAYPTVSAIGLTELLHKDKAKAEKRYLGKIIVVEGDVASMMRNSVRKEGSVILAGYRPPPDPKTGGESLAFQVKCAIKPAALAKVGLLAKKQRVHVTGRFKSHSIGDVTLTECSLEVENSGVLPRLTAEEITKKFVEKDPSVNKYLDKEVIITGVIADLVAKSGFVVKLAGEGRTQVICTMEEDEFKTLKKGEKVSLNGEVSVFGDQVNLLQAFLANK